MMTENRSVLPKPQELYRHFRGGLYQIVTLARLESNEEEMVVYQALYAPYQVWARPLKEFCELLDPARFPETGQRHRFERVDSGRPEAGDRADSERSAAQDAGEVSPLDPMVERFLDAGTMEERLNILMAVRSRVTDQMIDTMAMASGLEIEEGEVMDRWNDLRECLLTIGKYEQSRSHYEQ